MFVVINNNNMNKNFSIEEIEKLNLILNEMLDEFNCGNDNEYELGRLLESRWEECEKGDLDLYDEEDVKFYFECKTILGKNIYKVIIDECEYSLYVEGEDLILSWINNLIIGD
jgi:hypothetical protein